jgi:hypothetical protein
MTQPTAPLFLYDLSPAKEAYIVEQVVIAPNDDSDGSPIMIPVYVFGAIVAAESAKAARTLMSSMGGITGPTSVWENGFEVSVEEIGTANAVVQARGEHVVMRHFQAQGAA